MTLSRSVISVNVLSVAMRSIALFKCYAEFHFSECRYAECRFAECHGALSCPKISDADIGINETDWEAKANIAAVAVSRIWQCRVR